MKKILRNLTSSIWTSVHVKNGYSLLIVPQAIHNPHRLYLSKTLLNIVLYMAVVAVTVLGIEYFFHYREYFQLRRVAGPILSENHFLKKENRQLTQEKKQVLDDIASLQAQIEKERQDQAKALGDVYCQLEALKKFATDLKIMAGFKLPEDKAKALGPNEGGPSLPVSEYYTDMFKLHGSELLDALAERRKTLTGAMGAERTNLKDLWNFLETKKSLLAGTPEIYPVTGPINSEFGIRGGEFHPGLDIAAPVLTPVKVTGDGVVVFLGFTSGYGNLIEVDHGQGYTTRYAHLSEFGVKLGDRVSKGQIIGFVGVTGRTTGPHLHYEVRLNGVPVDPTRYLTARQQPDTTGK
jgi:hypothetical protein